MIICSKCGSIATYNSYFDAFMCGYCQTKNYNHTDNINKKCENEKISRKLGLVGFFNKMTRDRWNNRQHNRV